MRIAIVGLGSAGSVAAVELARAGHDVTLLERAPDPGPVGAGIWLLPLGLRVLDRLGVLENLAAQSRPVTRVRMVRPSGRRVVHVAVADAGDDLAPLGVNRGALFTLLRDLVADSAVDCRLGVAVTDVLARREGFSLLTDSGEHGPYDLVVGADGSRSTVRRAMHAAGGTVRRDREYAYGALWAIVPDSERSVGDELYQCMDGTTRYLGVLPTGADQASIFWSARRPAAQTTDMAGWREQARGLAGPYAHLLDRVERLLPATYRDVQLANPFLRHGTAGVVVIGDAAHAMSPQLGAGTSLALADAWSLARACAQHRTVPEALTAYARDRRAHVRWYQWWTRLMMPVFQSDLRPLGPPRDALAPLVSALPWVRHLGAATLVGDRVSPWSAYDIAPAETTQPDRAAR